MTLIYENDFNLAEAKKLNFRDEYVDLEYDNSYFEIFKKPNLNSLKEKLIKDEIEVKRSTPEVKDLSDLELDNLNVEILNNKNLVNKSVVTIKITDSDGLHE